jgi:3-hydroxybutyryl-CoA dehydratase
MKPPTVGERLPPAALGPFAPAEVARYAEASGDSNPIHVDPAVAAAAGLGAPIAQGMLVMAHLVRMAEQWRGDALVMGARSLFVRPIGLDERLAVDGRVVAGEVARNVTSDGDGAAWQCTLRLTARSAASPVATVVEVRLVSPADRGLF